MLCEDMLSKFFEDMLINFCEMMLYNFLRICCTIFVSMALIFGLASSSRPGEGAGEQQRHLGRRLASCRGGRGWRAAAAGRRAASRG